MENSEEKKIEKEESQEDTQLHTCQKERDDWKDRALRAAADFANYKKRVEKDQALWKVNAQATVLADLLDTLDDLDRAIAENEKKEKTPELTATLAGLALIRDKFSKLLHKYNVTEITQIKIFDPQLHEALVHLESKEHKPGEIIQILQKGYLIKDQVLRPAKVSVAK